ncbi:putative sulfate exporter family transporter [Nocardioides dubius]|uniref:Sulfate exporter family transporter n=1 Tax=Nocardioides dubius TaxID=317019 RepID=A0ABN1TUJ4_9ACTN
MTSTLPPRTRRRLPAVLAPLAAAGVSLLAAQAVPFVGALMWGLIAGALVANLLRGREGLERQARASKPLIRLGVALLGLQLSVSALVDVGIGAVLIIVATVVVTFTTTLWLGPRLGVERELTALIAAGFSICGAAAIAASQDAVRASQRNVAAAVALVTLFGTATMLAIPVLADLLHLSDTEAGIWAGASIHEIAQVIASASLIGAATAPVAIAIKLGRVTALAPVVLVLARRHGSTDAPGVPWFVLGFLAACLVGSTGLLPGLVTDAASIAATVLLAAGMYGLGLGLTGRDLAGIGTRAVALGTIATLVAMGVPLLLLAIL